MIPITYSDAKARLVDILSTASEPPVMIVRCSAPDVVIISAEEYDIFRQAKFKAAMAHIGADNLAVFRALADK